MTQKITKKFVDNYKS